MAEWAHPDTVLKPTDYPNIDFQFAYDTLAMCAYHAGGTAAVRATSAFHERELLSRLAGRAAAFTGAERGLACALWAQPVREDAAAQLTAVAAALAPGGALAALVVGALAARLTEYRTGAALPTGTPMSGRAVARLLMGHGFTVAAVYAFHTPASVLYGLAAGLFTRRRQLDAADRWLYRMRRAFTAQRAARLLLPVSALGVLVARKGGG